MASSLQALILEMLEQSVERLRLELKILEHQMIQHKDGMYITHDGHSSLVVYCSRNYKAYIPKKFDDWPVQYIEWTGGDIDINIDQPILFN